MQRWMQSYPTNLLPKPKGRRAVGVQRSALTACDLGPCSSVHLDGGVDRPDKLLARVEADRAYSFVAHNDY